MNLSGLIAVIGDGQVVEVRDLGPDPVACKPGAALPLVDDKPPLGPGQKYGAPTFEIGEESVTRHWPVETIPVERSQIDAERERRIALPLTVAVPSGLAFQINMDAFAQRNIGGLATLGMYLQTANPSQVTPFMDYTNTLQPLTPADLVAVGLQAQQRIGTVYGYSFALKAMNPIPADYADDSYWGGA